jgi:GNAT superfamily N-acetyltransferase
VKVSAPEALSPRHGIADFACGNPVLDDWLQKRALPNQRFGGSRTYVVAVDGRVIGYYALAAGAASLSQAPGRIRRNMPNPIPAIILGRLAVDRAWQGKGVGSDLLRDAIVRARQAAEIAGIRALLVHAIDERAAAFYQKAGFIPSPLNPLTYFLDLAQPPTA